MVSHQLIDNTHEPDMMITSSHINQPNSELDIALKISFQHFNHQICLFQNIFQFVKIFQSLPPNLHQTIHTNQNLLHQHSTHQIHNAIVEPEIQQEFVTTINIENNECDVAYKKLNVDNVSNTKTPKSTKKPK